jgi:hypothetical protein
MVIDDFNVIGIPVLPSKADAPPIIDADAVLSHAFPFKRFESIGRWNSQIPESLSLAQHPEFPESDALDVSGEPPRRGPVEQRLRVSRLKRSDHTVIL